MRIDRRKLRRLLPLAAALVMLPLAGDANNVQCCSVATSFATSLFGGGNGDEDFFSVPAGSPNLMILLGNTTEMLDFANPLPFPTWVTTGTSSQGTCDVASLATYATSAVADPAPVPYDNGYSSTTALTTDAPPWATVGANACTPLASGATAATTSCLFSPNGYYFYPTQLLNGRWVGKLGGAGALGDPSVTWATASAKEYPTPATICATGRVVNPTECASCLTTKGYYLFRDQSVSGNGKPNGAFFRGSFLNVFPPKFVVARKLVKQLARVDTAVTSYVDNVRMGLAILGTKPSSNANQKNSLATSDGGVLVVPLGPNCSVYPARQEDMATPRQKIIDAVNTPATVFFNQSNAGVITNPVAETLYQIGQYFSNYPTAGNKYTSLFGSSWVTGTNVEWNEKSNGVVDAGWVNDTDQRSFCWSCQQSSVVVISDGEPWNDNNLPQGGNTTTAHASIVNSDGVGDFRYWTNGKIACPGCGTDIASTNGSVSNLLHKVAAFLNDTDLRPELSGVQNVHTYTISFGLDPTVHAAAKAILQKTADLGGGTYASASNPEELEQALHDAATDVLARATSFSVSNTTPLQTSQNNQLFLARFRPSASPSWEGHLYRFRVFNEFAEGCDSTKSTANQILTTCTKKDGTTTVTLNPNLNSDDSGGKAVCASIFILDGNCDTVMEDENGVFKKASFNATTHALELPALAASRVDAVPFWDAGKTLSTSTATGYRSADGAATTANRRKIWTLIDSDDDGRYTSSDALVEVTTELETSAATSWTKLKAALGVDATTCTKLFQKMGVNGLSGWDLSSTVAAADRAAALNRCAEQVIHFVRGWDVLDEDDDGCGGPGFPTNSSFCPVLASGARANGEQRDRANDSRPAESQTFWKLGDIFHSSPALVNPPAMEFVCDLALDNQCVSTLHSPAALSGTTQTPIQEYTVGTAKYDAYEKYRRTQIDRRRLLLVGANDGMLHAFDAGSAQTSRTPDAAGNHPYSAGDGAELWAFIPPDLLPKLKNAPLGHEYFVDGNIMVRDVWVDGGSTGTGTRDGKKQEGEFHTIAVLSERSGGTEYVALDVTDPLDPKFRWIFPEPCARDVAMIGQSWSGFAPRPPPIGPVKLALAADSPQDPLHRGFEERWVVMVNGGYDSSLTRGRGIWMMDAWTGATIWRFTNDEFANDVNSSGGMWPVPGAVALLDIGAGDQPKVDSDGFFDTATWGDIGGQIYVARFNDPDKTKWAAARAFEENRQADDSQPIASRSEFYYMTGNTVDPATGYLHTYIGSGNRERMLQNGPGCGPDNVFGCFQAGCNTDVTTVYDYGSCSYRVKAHANNGTIRQDRSDFTDGGTACADDTQLTCSGIKVDIKVETVCNGWKPTGGAFHASLDCAADGTCTTQDKVQKGGNAPGSRLTASTSKNRFYGVWAYGGARTFNDTDGAVAFDAGRFTDHTYAGTCAGPGGACTIVDATTATVNTAGSVTCASGVTKCSADSYDAGWMYEYGHATSCPLASGCSTTDWNDEKTGSGATVLAGCVDWNTFRPMGSATSAISPCETNAGTARNFTYLADYLKGVPSPTCGVATTDAWVRATSRATNVPPLDPTHMISLGANGQTTYSVAVIEPGAPPQVRQVGTGNDGNAMIYWLEVPRPLHACRHSDATQCE